MLKNAGKENLLKITENNLRALNSIIQYNAKNGIRLFRISSETVPFISSPVNQTMWEKVFEKELEEIGKGIKKYGIRVSVHPGQYSVVNSPDEGVFKRAADDLYSHAALLRTLKTDEGSKIIIHTGGAYNDKYESAKRFIRNFNTLDISVKNRLAIENDDSIYNIDDVLYIGESLKIPVIYDVFHNKVNPCKIDMGDNYYIARCKKLQGNFGGRVKIHYSQQEKGAKKGSHSKSIEIAEFLEFYNGLDDKDIDIMLEVKDKNISANKCINCLYGGRESLFRDLKRYKYTLIEKNCYDGIKRLCQNGENAAEIYTEIERALTIQSETGYTLESADLIFDIIKGFAEGNEIRRFSILKDNFKNKRINSVTVKNFLYRLCIKYNIIDVLESYYFYYV